ncbi:MAG: hypothetical protein LBC29_00245, partial [Propionibacteriaceae bacterium]|nr:hypothetical protein [Propionibacteriaceae bacterium]
MKTAMQLKARSRNLSAKTGTPPHIIQRNFFFERFLERTALSPCRDSAACVAFGTANTRMKDYYDIHVLT